MEVHELLKKMRVNRGISQKKLSNNITTRQTLINYENGKSQIPFIILVEFLGRMNITLDEFAFHLNIDESRKKNLDVKKFLLHVCESEERKDYTLKKLSKAAKESNDIVDIKNYLVAKTLDWYHLSEYEKKLIGKDKTYFLRLKNYLDGIDEWSRYDITCFTSLLFLFDTNYIVRQIIEIERMIGKNRDYEIFFQSLSALYNNAFLLMLERKEIALSSKYLQKLQKVKNKQLFSRSVGIYTKFYELLIKRYKTQKNTDNEIKKMFDALMTLNLEKVVKEFSEDLKKFDGIYF
ncbi:MAG: helix-turn-helix domain-containing protein [Streptococcaceae bacterium]|jgi:transcriptional regulator with XRE-family HTH domain|nr:helix-turn-helix domain-containing protein [Streptococcaceae bacterium]